VRDVQVIEGDATTGHDDAAHRLRFEGLDHQLGRSHLFGR
jgi:hypothetical protein